MLFLGRWREAVRIGRASLCDVFAAEHVRKILLASIPRSSPFPVYSKPALVYLLIRYASERRSGPTASGPFHILPIFAAKGTIEQSLSL